MKIFSSVKKLSVTAKTAAIKNTAAILLVLCCMQSTQVIAQEWQTLEKTTAPELYAEKCGMCHRAGGMGTGILGRRLSAEQAKLENRTDLQAAYIETAVRAGVGVMFPISRAEVSDAQLQVLTGYLVKEPQR
ncbi:MAG: cytochrome c [Pseudomonadota bacterium]